MSGIPSNSNNSFIKGMKEVASEPAKYLGPVSMAPGVKEGVKALESAAHSLKDSVKEMAKTPQGKAVILGGILTATPFVPVLGPALIFGGLGSAAMKKISEKIKEHGAGKAVQSGVGAAAAQAGAKAGAAAAATKKLSSDQHQVSPLHHPQKVAEAVAQAGAKAVAKGVAAAGSLDSNSKTAAKVALEAAGGAILTPVAPIAGTLLMSKAAYDAGKAIVDSINKK